MPPSENAPFPNAEQDDVSWINSEFFKGVLPARANVVHIDVQRATGKGDNYFSAIFRARVDYRIHGSDAVHSQSFILKSPPEGELVQQFIEEMNIFRREISIYGDVLPKMYAFADSRLGRDSFKRYSAMSLKTERPNTLLLEDLKPHGFIMASRKDMLDFLHAKLTVKNLARHHALSMVYCENNPALGSHFEEFFFVESNREKLVQFVSPVLKGMNDAVSKWEGFGKIVSKLELLKGTIVDRLFDIWKPFPQFQKVLLHGDCWVNNLLFKYFENGEPVDMRFVDFQLSRKASPALDLNYFFFSSLQIDTRKHHYDDLLHEYYDEFSSCAKQLGYSEDVFTFDQLCQEMIRTGLFGFYSSLSIMITVLAEPEDVIDMKEVTAENMESGEIFTFDKTYEKPAFRKIFQDLLPYFDNMGILD